MAHESRSTESHFTFACVGSSRVEACGVRVAFVWEFFVCAFIDIYAFMVDLAMARGAPSKRELYNKNMSWTTTEVQDKGLIKKRIITATEVSYMTKV